MAMERAAFLAVANSQAMHGWHNNKPIARQRAEAGGTNGRISSYPAPKPYDMSIIAWGRRRRSSRRSDPLVADAFALYIKTKNFHWHLPRDAHFRDSHLLLDEQADEIFESIDGAGQARPDASAARPFAASAISPSCKPFETTTMRLSGGRDDGGACCRITCIWPSSSARPSPFVIRTTTRRRVMSSS